MGDIVAMLYLVIYDIKKPDTVPRAGLSQVKLVARRASRWMSGRTQTDLIKTLNSTGYIYINKNETPPFII